MDEISNKYPKRNFNAQKYILAFFITLTIFIFSFWLSNYINNKKISKLDSIRKNIQIDLMSLETQFSILENSACQTVNQSLLTSELYPTAKKLSYMEAKMGSDNSEVKQLKKYYSLLEIRDWLLLKKINKRCKLNLNFILYFYSEPKNCPLCETQGYVLTYFRQKYPSLRVFSFDYDLDLSALSTIKSLYSLKRNLPIIVINGKIYYGFKNRKDIEKLLPAEFSSNQIKNKSNKSEKFPFSSSTDSNFKQNENISH